MQEVTRRSFMLRNLIILWPNVINQTCTLQTFTLSALLFVCNLIACYYIWCTYPIWLFYAEFVITVVLYVIYFSISHIIHLCFSLLIGYVDSKDPYMWKGYLYASLFLLTSVMTSFFFHQLFHIGMTLGMRVKSSVIAVVYKKVN